MTSLLHGCLMFHYYDKKVLPNTPFTYRYLEVRDFKY
jgi:hypothetical protein